MKSRSVIIGIEAALILIAVVLSVFLNAVWREAVSVELYDRYSREAVAEMHGGDPDEDADMVTAYIGLDAETQHSFAEALSAYMKGSSDNLPEVLNEKEQVHLSDVRRLIRLAGRLPRLLLGFCAILVVSMAWLSRDKNAKPLRSAGLGFAAGALVPAGLIALALTNFETAFVGMHRLLFTNDLWLMDPRTDIIIRIMPSELFVNAAGRCLQSSCAQLVIIAVMLILLYFFMRRLIKRWVKEPEHG